MLGLLGKMALITLINIVSSVFPVTRDLLVDGNYCSIKFDILHVWLRRTSESILSDS